MTRGFLTTHVLDTANGVPAAGMSVELFVLEGGERTLMRSTTTNSDGRTDGPLIPNGELERGEYELLFSVGEYFGRSETGGEPPFLDEVPLRFGVSDADSHYHVPLLVSPYSYSTYRGS